MKHEKMKVSIVSPTMSGGGAQKVAINLANQWSQQNIEVELIVLKNTGVYFDQLSKKVDLKVLNLRKVRYGLLPLLFHLKKTKPNYVISNIRHTNIFLGFISIFLPNTKFFGREANTLDGIKGKGFITQKAYLLLMRCSYKKLHGVISNSSHTFNDLVSHNIRSERSIIIGNPVINREANNLVQEKCNDPWIQSKRFRTIMGVGRLTKQKNFELLIKAFNKLQVIAPDTRLIIIGAGPKSKELNNLISDYKLHNIVKILPFQDNIYKWMKGADVFVSTSIYEGFGNVIVESLFCGTEVVVTDCPGAPVDIVKHGKYGNIAHSNDAESVMQAIARTLSDKKDRSNFLYDRSVQFSVERISTKYLSFMLDNQENNDRH